MEILKNGEIEAVLSVPGERHIRQRGKLEQLGSDRLQDLRSQIVSLREGKLEGNEELIMRLGSLLYQALFPDKIRDLFEEAVQRVREAQHENPDLRLRVFITVDRECLLVRGWPLEFLYSKAAGWLATAEKLITLSRRIPIDPIVLDHLTRRREDPPLRVLVVVSSPEGYCKVLIAPTLESMARWATATQQGSLRTDAPLSSIACERPRAVRAAAGRPAAAREPRIRIKLLGAGKEGQEDGIECIDQPATFEALGKLIADWHPHVLHFIGHGEYEDERGGSVVLVKDETDQPDPCSAYEFMELFS
ncbi:MAG: hypothetical protein ACLQDL_15505, partial [Spirochaetia bacterium]